MKKLRIDTLQLDIAFENSADEMDYFLDRETGAVILVTEDDKRAISDFEEDVDIEEGDDEQAKFEKWLEDYRCQDWQKESIREAFPVMMDSSGRFAAIPKQDSREGYRDMEAFVETVEDGNLRRLLDVALNGKGAFRRFKDALYDFPAESERWFKFSEERVKERILEWLEDEEIELEA
jgi:hypothetical protein